MLLEGLTPAASDERQVANLRGGEIASMATIEEQKISSLDKLNSFLAKGADSSLE